MITYLGDFPVSHTAVCIPWDSFAAATGAPSATTNFVAGDILIYKDGGLTQRTSSAGITVTTSFDTQTGLQMIVIDLSDNTDAGFYAAGHEYQVGVADVTIDAQTVRFWVATFSIERAGGILALLKGTSVKVDVNTIKTQTVTAAGAITYGAFVGNATAALGVDANGRVDISKILGTAISTPATAGILDVNVKNMNNVAATSITTINANQGTTQPINFTGTAGSALVKSDTVDWAGTAVSNPTVAGVPNVNVKTWNDLTTVALPLIPTVAGRTLDVSATGEAGVDWANVGAPTTTVGLTGTTISTAQIVASVAGAVGSVTGAVGSVTGAVGSVTGAVGSVASGGITAASIADGAIDNATFAADTGLQSIRSGTAQAGSATTITLDASASSVDSFYNNCLIILTGGTGSGQARFITAYVGSTKVATVATWATNPNSSTTFAIRQFDSVAGATAPTAAQNATAVWQDLLASSDFSTASSIGKLLKDDINATISSVATQATDIQSRLPAALTANGNMKSSMLEILTTALTETSGLLAGGFKKFFNVASPTGTLNSIPAGIPSASGGLPLVSDLATAATVSDTVWDEILSGHTISGSAGAALSSAGTAADPWSTALPGSYGAGTAGNIVGNNITGNAFTRLGAPVGASISADVAAVKTDTAAVKVQTDKLTFTVANQVDSNVLDWKSATAPAMTGDSFARLGAPAGASVSADIAAAKVDTAAIKLKTDNLPTGIKKNTALANFEFLMIDSTDHVSPKTGLTITATRSIDGSVFSACTNSASEVANGMYKINFSAADLNGSVITFKFTATGADQRTVTIVTSL